jgi:hypothetical protein
MDKYIILSNLKKDIFTVEKYEIYKYIGTSTYHKRKKNIKYIFNTNILKNDFYHGVLQAYLSGDNSTLKVYLNFVARSEQMITELWSSHLLGVVNRFKVFVFLVSLIYQFNFNKITHEVIKEFNYTIDHKNDNDTTLFNYHFNQYKYFRMIKLLSSFDKNCYFTYVGKTIHSVYNFSENCCTIYLDGIKNLKKIIIS